jgi:hypothetical protein
MNGYSFSGLLTPRRNSMGSAITLILLFALSHNSNSSLNLAGLVEQPAVNRQQAQAGKESAKPASDNEKKKSVVEEVVVEEEIVVELVSYPAN